MEQSRQNRTPEDAYQERLSGFRSAAIRRAMMTVVAVVAVATLFLFFVEKRSYHSYKVLNTSEQEDVVSTQYVEMDGDILRYSPDESSVVDASMNTVVERDLYHAESNCRCKWKQSSSR